MTVNYDHQSPPLTSSDSHHPGFSSPWNLITLQLNDFTKSDHLEIEPPQCRYRSDRSGRDGSEPDPEHERPWLRGLRLQSHHAEGGRLSEQRGEGHEDRGRALAGGDGAQAEEAETCDDAGQR